MLYLDIQPGLNIGASMNQMTTVAILEPTDMERGQPQQGTSSINALNVIQQVCFKLSHH